LRAEPDWNALPESVVPAIRTLIRRCLAKDRAQRIADMSVAKFLLSEPAFRDPPPASSISPPSRARFKTTLFIASAVVMAIAVASAIIGAFRSPGIAPIVARLSISLSEGQTFSSGRNTSIAISPDGTQIVYVANSRLYRRAISDFESIAIPGSES